MTPFIYSPRPGVTYEAAYEIVDGSIYVAYQGARSLPALAGDDSLNIFLRNDLLRSLIRESAA